MRLSAMWIGPLLRASLAADGEHEDGSSQSPPHASALAARAGALVDALRAAYGRVLTPAEEQAIVVLTRALEACLGEDVEEQHTTEES